MSCLEGNLEGCLRLDIITPRTRTVTVYRSLSDIHVLTEQDTLEGGDVVPGWTLLVRAIFE